MLFLKKEKWELKLQELTLLGFSRNQEHQCDKRRVNKIEDKTTFPHFFLFACSKKASTLVKVFNFVRSF
jgi:hypothetical protein